MEQIYVFANREDSLNIFNDNAGGRFRVYFPNPYVLDGTWECPLLEVTFVPKLTTPTRRIYAICDFVENYYVRDSYIPVLQSLSALNEDATDVTFENPIYHRVRGGIGQHIEISMRDDNLEIIRFKEDHVFCLVHFRRKKKKRSR
jgi:hypothetical protein